MKNDDGSMKKRVDILARKGIEELLSPQLYEDLSSSGFWIEEAGDNVVIKCYPDDVEVFLQKVRDSKIDMEEITVSDEPPVDYAEMTRKYFRPIHVDGVTVRAPWNKKTKCGLEIVIEPGMAFGTGRHESTRLMIKLMGDIDFRAKKVADIGCGSAILSLYASLMGAESVFAVDYDADTVASAEKNVELNGLSNIKLLHADLKAVKGVYDVVLANIDIGTFKLTAGHVMGLVSEGGYLLVSGVLHRDQKALLGLFEPLTLKRGERRRAWQSFLFQKIHR